MKFATALGAPAPRSEVYKVIAWVYAALLVMMVVGQLFSFEKFIPLIQDYWLPGGHGTATLVAGLIVVSEVFALPFLLRMPLSPLMRWVSLVSCLLAAGLWVFLGIFILSSESPLLNSGLLGVKVTVPTGAVQLVVAVGLAVLAVLSVWGLLPLRKK